MAPLQPARGDPRGLRAHRPRQGAERPAGDRLHALPNALLPVITLSGMLLGLVLAGSIPVERAFGTPGLGYAMFTAVSERDVFVMQNLVFLYSVVFVLLNILVDVTIAWLDPEDPLPMTATHDRDLSDRAVAHRRLAHALAAARRRRGSSAARRCRPSGAASPPLIVAMAIAAPVDRALRAAEIRLPRACRSRPSEKHWFGTDQIGRDTLSRVIYGSRASLTVAFGAVLFGTTLGALWGLACGYFGGRFDIISQRIIEFLQSFPDLILAMAIAMALGGGLRHGDRGHRHHPHPVRRPGDPLGRAVAQGDAVCRGGARPRRLAHAPDVPPHPAAMRGALPDPGDHPSRRRHRHRGLARLSRRRHPAADADLGQHAVRCAERRPGAAVVAGAVPRRRDHHHRARLQPLGDGIRDMLDPRLRGSV